MGGEGHRARYQPGAIGPCARPGGPITVVNPANDDPVTTIKDLTHGEGAGPVRFDSSGSAQGSQSRAIRCPEGFGGKDLFSSGEGGELKVDVSPDLLRKTDYSTRVLDLLYRGTGRMCALRRRSAKSTSKRYFTDRWKLDQAEESL